ncbi:hypothetical protein ACFPRL_18580 [Pseudoclavibacter helvolus]
MLVVRDERPAPFRRRASTKTLVDTSFRTARDPRARSRPCRPRRAAACSSSCA